MNEPEFEFVNETTKLEIQIISFGQAGNAAADQLQQDEFLCPGEDGKALVRYFRLENRNQEILKADNMTSTDMVVILASGNDSDCLKTAENIVKSCSTSKTLCYTLLSVDRNTPETEMLIDASRSVLVLNPSDIHPEPVDNYLANAVKNVLHPITGRGLIGVDFADIRTILTCGKKMNFAIASATGIDRATQATEQALSQFEDKTSILSLICNLTVGFNVTMDEVADAGDLVHSNLPDDSIVILSTTLNPDMEGEMQVGITVVS